MMQYTPRRPRNEQASPALATEATTSGSTERTVRLLLLLFPIRGAATIQFTQSELSRLSFELW